MVKIFTPVDVQRGTGAIAFLRSSFHNNGAEGESVHLVCALLEAALTSQPAETTARDLLQRARVRLVDEPDSRALDTEIAAFLAGDETPQRAPTDASLETVGPFVLASFARLQEAINTDQGPIEIALRMKEHEEAIRRACEAEKARLPLRVVTTDVSLVARALDPAEVALATILRAWRAWPGTHPEHDARCVGTLLRLSDRLKENGWIHETGVLTEDAVTLARAGDASRPDDPDMAHLRAELQGAIAEATAYAKTIGLRDAEIARLENESRSGLSEEEAQRWGEIVAAKLDKDVDYEAILAVEAMRLTRGDALPEIQSTATDAAIDAAVAQRPSEPPDPRATLHAGDPASLADVVAASAREPHADVVLQALHVSGGAAAVDAMKLRHDPRLRCARCDKPVGATGVRDGEDVLCLPCSIDDLDGRDLDREP